MKTKNGIYLDIRESEYFVKVGKIKFYFSSKLYKKKFEKRYTTFVNEEIEKFKIRSKVSNISEILYHELMKIYLYSLYKQIEKRGYRVEIEK